MCDHMNQAYMLEAQSFTQLLIKLEIQLHVYFHPCTFNDMDRWQCDDYLRCKSQCIQAVLYRTTERILEVCLI